MRVMLVRPAVPPHTIGLKHIMICEPLELEYVAAGLNGHDVEIVDLILERGFESRLRRFRPDVVGTSCYISGVNEVIKICRTAKRWNAPFLPLSERLPQAANAQRHSTRACVWRIGGAADHPEASTFVTGPTSACQI